MTPVMQRLQSKFSPNVGAKKLNWESAAGTSFMVVVPRAVLLRGCLLMLVQLLKGELRAKKTPQRWTAYRV